MGYVRWILWPMMKVNPYGQSLRTAIACPWRYTLADKSAAVRQAALHHLMAGSRAKALGKGS
jgi:hypothetical protein